MNNYLFILFFCTLTSTAQTFTRKDSLQGGLREERTCFDVLHYDLDLTINPETRFF